MAKHRAASVVVSLGQANHVFFLLVFCALVSCKNFSETKARRAAPLAIMLKELSEKIIGSYPQEVAAYQHELSQAIGTAYEADKEQYYRHALAKILASNAWREQGFFNLHRDRLLLDLQNSDANAEYYLNFLKMEFEQRARADNYWDILTYQDRFFRFYYCIDENGYNPDLPSWWKGAAVNCVERLIIRIVEDEEGKVARHCQTINQHYKEIFSQDFCNLNGLDKDSRAALIARAKPQIHALLALDLASKISPEHLFTPVTLPAELVRGENFLVKTDSYLGDGEYYITARVPADLQGVHASHYWLSRHTTTKQNQNLHRAKIIWHSWFCEKISPDQATLTAKVPTAAEIADVSEYFDRQDAHTRKDRNCFDCHRRIQPVANYFGKLAWDGKNFLAPESEAFDRPGGYWLNDKDYFSELGQQRGMAGLAELLSNLPRVHKCVVNSTWENFFGSKYGLTATDTAAAVQAFKDSGFNYRTLITHLLTKPEAIQYFTAGHQVFYDMVTSKKLTCEVAASKSNISTKDIIKNSCVSCHTHEDGKEDYFVVDGSIIANNGNLPNLYNIVDSGYMPVGSTDYDQLKGYSVTESNDIQKKILTCHIARKLTAAGLNKFETPVKQDMNAMGHEGDGT